MAKQNNKQARTTVDEVNETLTSWEQKLENNRKLIYGGVGAIVAVFAAVAIFIMVRNNGMQDAQNMVNKADMEYVTKGDSAGLAAYKKAANESYALLTAQHKWQQLFFTSKRNTMKLSNFSKAQVSTVRLWVLLLNHSWLTAM